MDVYSRVLVQDIYINYTMNRMLSFSQQTGISEINKVLIYM